MMTPEDKNDARSIDKKIPLSQHSDRYSHILNLCIMCVVEHYSFEHREFSMDFFSFSDIPFNLERTVI